MRSDSAAAARPSSRVTPKAAFIRRQSRSKAPCGSSAGRSAVHIRIHNKQKPVAYQTTGVWRREIFSRNPEGAPSAERRGHSPLAQTDARADRPLFARPCRRAWFSRFRNTKKGLPSWQSFARQATANGAERYSAETPKGPPRLSVAGTARSREPTRGQTDRFLTALTAARGSAASATQKKDCPLGSPFFVAQREGFEPSVPLRGTHDFQSCSLGRSDISAYALLCATLSIINFYSSFVNLSGRCFTDNIVKIPIITPAATLNAHTNGSCTYSDGDSSTSTATLVRAILLQIAPNTLTETRLTFG